MLSQDLLQELFDYDPITGWFTNRRSRGRAFIGSRAGGVCGHGYRMICIGYSKYYEHRLAWLYTYGVLPEEIDHKDGNKTNNAINNLRLSNRTYNLANADTQTGMSGHRGVFLRPGYSKWVAQIQVGGQVKWLGTFTSPEEAAKAYKEAADKHFGEFAFHNREKDTN